MKDFYAAPAGDDPSGFFTDWPGWVVLTTTGFGTPRHPWAVGWAPTRDVAEVAAREYNRIWRRGYER